MLEIDEHGLDEMDKRILETAILKFGGGPVGVASLAVAVGEERTPSRVYEPYLIMEATFIKPHRDGVVTDLGYRRLRLPPPPGRQTNLL